MPRCHFALRASALTSDAQNRSGREASASQKAYRAPRRPAGLQTPKLRAPALVAGWAGPGDGLPDRTRGSPVLASVVSPAR